MMRFVLLIVAFALSCTTTQNPHRPSYRVKVRSGDTLASIAVRYGTTWQAIARDNAIQDYRTIKVGDVLIVHPGPGGYVASGSSHGADSGFLGTEHSKNTRRHGEKKASRSSDSGTSEDSKSRGLLFGIGDNDQSAVEWPVHGEVSSFYGPRWGKFHHGIDIRAPIGHKIRSAAKGKIVLSKRLRGYGKTVIVEHEGFQTLYAHCHKLLVKKGDFVDAGQVIATVGSSGNARGKHLHFEYRDASGKTKDPMMYLPTQQLLSDAHRQ